MERMRLQALPPSSRAKLLERSDSLRRHRASSAQCPKRSWNGRGLEQILGDARRLQDRLEGMMGRDGDGGDCLRTHRYGDC